MTHQQVRYVKLSAAAEALDTTEDSLVVWLRSEGYEPVTVHKAGGVTFMVAPMGHIAKAYASLLTNEWEEENNI
jgi:hypothetical protein